jgi:ubiquitin C-terminal hydrolase
MIVRQSFRKCSQLCLFIAPKLKVRMGWTTNVTGLLGLDNNCMCCLLEQCILGCLQHRSDGVDYLDKLYSQLIEEDNCFINGRQVWICRRAYLIVEEHIVCGVRLCLLACVFW